MFDLRAELTAALRAARNETPARAMRGGNASYCLPDGTPVASDSGQCPRTAFLRSHGVQSTPDFTSQMTFHLGYAFESLFEKLAGSPKVEKLESQVPVTLPVEGSSVPFQGTVDFIVTFRGGYRVVVDTKSVSSLRSFHGAFVERKVKPHYLAQLVSYMEATGIDHGLLVVGAFLYVPNDWLTAGKQRALGRRVEPDLAVFDIRLRDGEIIVGGEPAPFTLEAVRAHRGLVATAIERNEVPLVRPVPADGWSPCQRCPFSAACLQWEAHGTRDPEEFVSLARKEVSK